VNTIFDRRLSLLLGLTTIAVLGSGLSAQAETRTPAPVPGTMATSAAVLTTDLPVTPTVTPKAAPASDKGDSRVAQDIDVGQPTRGGSSYIGVAGNIGLSGGETALGVGNIAVISKIGLLRNISVRPSAVFGDNTTVLIPVTYDFALGSTGVLDTPVPIAPYIGGGIAINTGNRSDTGGLISAGVDVPLTHQFTATAGVNVGFINNTSVGLLIGIGYNFSGAGFAR
jgi:hypothetical protein